MLEQRMSGKKGESRVINEPKATATVGGSGSSIDGGTPVKAKAKKKAKPTVEYSNRYRKKKTTSKNINDKNSKNQSAEDSAEEKESREIPLADDFKFSSSSQEDLRKIKFDEDELL
jgi:hypothetical protein